MIAGIGGIDGDDRQMRQVFPLAERQLGHAMRLVDRFLREFMAEPMLVDRDQAEAARRERIAEHRIDPRPHPRRPAADFAQHQIAGLGVLDIGEGSSRRSLLSTGDSQKRSPSCRPRPTPARPSARVLHRMSDQALPALLGPGEHAVADAERAAPPALDQPELRRRRIGVPLLGHRPDIAAVVDLDHAQHGDLRHAARLVKSAARRRNRSAPRRPCP